MGGAYRGGRPPTACWIPFDHLALNVELRLGPILESSRSPKVIESSANQQLGPIGLSVGCCHADKLASFCRSLRQISQYNKVVTMVIDCR